MKPAITELYRLLLLGRLNLDLHITYLGRSYEQLLDEYYEIAKYDKPVRECVRPFVDHLIERLYDQD